MPTGKISDLFYLKLLSPKIIFNLLRYVFLGRRPKAAHYPIFYVIDPSTVCRLRCADCGQGNGNSDFLSREFMSFDNFRVVFDKVKDYALIIELFNYGETFLNPEIGEILGYIKKSGIRCRVSSSLNFNLSTNLADSILNSSIVRLVCSIDGPTQESYQMYRKNGDLKLVLGNAKRLIQSKRSAGNPKIVYRMLAFEWNHKYIEDARRLAQDYGFDEFCVDPGTVISNGNTRMIWSIHDEKWKEVGGNWTTGGGAAGQKKRFCKRLFNSIVVGANGRNLVCCVNDKKTWEHKSLLVNSLDEVWNDKLYVNSRAITLGLGGDRTKTLPPCVTCNSL